MVKRKWSDLTASQKSKGVALIKEHSQFILKDEDDKPVAETDSNFIRRIADEWLYELALGLHRTKEALKARDLANDL